MSLSLLEQLCYCTTRITAQDSQKNIFSGTGFFFGFPVENGKTVPLLFTNKHVVQGMDYISLTLTKADQNGNPLDKEHISVTFPSSAISWFFHPDKNVDLCALPIAPILIREEEKGNSVFYRTFDPTLIPSSQDTEKIDAIEDIIMIGYPNGLWDEVNNKPLIRKGVTATNFIFDYNGKSEFVIDAACFPGSSGSPVLICNVGSYRDKNGNIKIGTNRIMLLGVLYAGPQLTVTGDLQVVNIPTSQSKVLSISHIPNNLGYVIKSKRINELIRVIKTKYELK